MVPKDKQLHIAAGAVVGVVAVVVFWPVRVPTLLGAVGAALAAGLYKEWSDARANRAARAAGLPPPHTVDPADVVYTVLGGTLAGLLGVLAEHLLHGG